MLRRRPVEAEWKPVGWTEPPDGAPVALESTESARWATVGRRLYLFRKRHQISKREAARRAGISEALWRQLEAGGKEVGGQVILPNPRPENLYAVASACAEDPADIADIFHAVGMEMPEGVTRKVSQDSLARKIARLSDRDRPAVEALVDALLTRADEQGPWSAAESGVPPSPVP